MKKTRLKSLLEVLSFIFVLCLVFGIPLLILYVLGLTGYRYLNGTYGLKELLLIGSSFLTYYFVDRWQKYSDGKQRQLDKELEWVDRSVENVRDEWDPYQDNFRTHHYNSMTEKELLARSLLCQVEINKRLHLCLVELMKIEGNQRKSFLHRNWKHKVRKSYLD